MTTNTKPKQPSEREIMDNATYQEDPEDDDLAEIRRQLGFDLLPINGGDRGGNSDG